MYFKANIISHVQGYYQQLNERQHRLQTAERVTAGYQHSTAHVSMQLLCKW